MGNDRLARRDFLRGVGLSVAGLAASGVVSADISPKGNITENVGRVAVIDITDLYHPHQDPGDNLDLIAAYGLPEIDLRAVILDVTEDYRRPNHPLQKPEYKDDTGPRDAGVIPVTQLNYIFNRSVPFGIGPFTRLKSPGDTMLDAPAFQQSGIELILNTLRETPGKVEILSFGSARPLAAAYNRDPDLLRKKVRRIHLSAGASSPGFTEWNVMLDPKAIACLLRSDLPIAIYPCATDSPFALGPNNTYWLLENLDFIRRMHPRLQAYLAYVFERSNRSDFLNVLDERVPEEVMAKMCARRHSVWETALWQHAARRKLVQRDGHYRLVPASGVGASETVLPSDLRPCRVTVGDDGLFTFEKTTSPTNFLIYERGDVQANQAALREALPALYQSIAGPQTAD